MPKQDRELDVVMASGSKPVRGDGSLVSLLREREAFLRQFFDLPTREQLEVFEVMAAFLGGPRPRLEDKVDKELVARRQAIQAMTAAAKHLGFPDGSRLKVAEFDVASRELGLGVSSKQVRTAWGTWREANRVFGGGAERATPAQSSLRRARSTKRADPDRALAGVREWLEDSHGIGGGQPSTFNANDYDNYVRLRNQAVDKAPLVQRSTVTRAVRLHWADCVACARGEADPVALRAQRAIELKAKQGPLGLIGARDVARMLDIPDITPATLNEPGFPTAVAKVGRGLAWVADDVRQYKQEATSPFRQPMLYAHRIVEAQELADHCGIPKRGLLKLVQRNDPRIPAPSGRIAKTPYWLRETITDFEPDPTLARDLAVRSAHREYKPLPRLRPKRRRPVVGKAPQG